MGVFDIFPNRRRSVLSWPATENSRENFHYQRTMLSRPNINQIKTLNKKFNVFTSLRMNEPMQKDHILSQYLPLNNTTYAIKDNFTTRREPTTCSSKMLENYISPFDSTVSNLLDQTGSECIGKTNMDEFGMGNSTVSGYFGPTLNPLYAQNQDIVEDYEVVNFSTIDKVDNESGEVTTCELLKANEKGTLHSYMVPKLYNDFNDRISSEQRIVGGSSGGSAAAVALDFVDFSIGSDTGGSVRLPACLTNIYGFKPTYGRISRWGLVAYAQSLDTVGIMSKNIDTIWKVFNTLDLNDIKDPSSLSDSIREEYAIERIESKKNVGKKFKVGIPEEFLLSELGVEVKSKWKELLQKLEASKLIEIYPISIPSIKYSLPAYYTLCTSEASSNLSRYDGIRYGYRVSENEYDGDLEPEFITTRTKGFGNEVKNRITLGNYALSSYGYDSHFMKATGVRGQLIEEFNKVFRDKNCLIEKKTFRNGNGVDMIIVPTTSGTEPMLIKDFNKMNPVESYMNDVFTIPMSLAGLPTMNIPYGGKSIGFQLVGQHGQDYKVLEFSRLVEGIVSE